jgi:aryl-alcohol dehydrogenase-like predicted oxidoreductase/histidinol phosphatase-like enzyme
MPRVAYGLMRLSSADGPGEERAIGLIHAALDAGVRWLDTADVYAPSSAEIGHNERLLRSALESWSGDRSKLIVATKGGLKRSAKKWSPDGRAKHLRRACEASLRALGVDAIDLYQLHVVDPKVPFTTSLRALAALQREGLIRSVGLCNVRAEELERARDLVPVASVQVALSPLVLTPLKNGVAELCAREGIPLLAHSPLGGHRDSRKLERNDRLLGLAQNLEITVFELALAWLVSLHPTIVPTFGASRKESLESSLGAAKLSLDADAIRALDHLFPASRALRTKREERAPRPASTEREVVLFVGYPGAGKTTKSESWTARGYRRLNRDERGGRLSDLLPELHAHLEAGTPRILMDNTYPERASRFDVIETAWRHAVPVRCVWLRTSLEDAQVNAVERMITRHGRLLSPDEIRVESRKDPNTFGPDAQFRYRRVFEEPRLEEGFSAIDLETPRFARAKGNARAVFFEYDGVLRKTRSGEPYPLAPDDIEVLAGRGETLRRFAAMGFSLLGVSYQPWVGSGRSTEALVRECFSRTHELLGLEGADVNIDFEFCPHEPGPAVCWCRKPLPGLGVVFVDRYGLDPARCLVVVASPSDSGFARRLGCREVDVDRFFNDTDSIVAEGWSGA